jgi:hypothetical protein
MPYDAGPLVQVIVIRLVAELLLSPCEPLRGLKRCAFDQAYK